LAARKSPRNSRKHAYITFGDHWRCERGFKRVEDECQSVEVPEHAFLSYNGDDWRCERGYKRADGGCRSLEVPEHAYLGFNGDDWVCDRGCSPSKQRRVMFSTLPSDE